MKIKVKDKEFSFEGYVFPINSVQRVAERCYEQGKLDGAREFAEWLPQHFDLRFSNNPEVWVDEYFNHTREQLSEWQKGAKNE